MSAVSTLDAQRLADYLRTHVRDFRGSLRVEQFAGGQSNPTYKVTAGDHRWVVRRKPPGVLLESAHAVEREHRVMAALASSDVPVPEMLALCADASVIGTPFYVMEFLEGRVFGDPALPALPPGERRAVYDELTRVIGALHRVDFDAIGLGDYGRPAGYLARQLSRWTSQYRASQTQRIEAMEHLIDWLPAHLPDAEETAIVHGDYRIDNLIFHPHEPRVLAVIDWELSTLGHPLVDFAYHCMSWRVTPDEFRGLKGHDLRALNIPSEADHVRAYCARTGRTDVSHWDYYIAFNMFRMAAILQGIFARSRQGNAASADAERTGRQARPMAEAAWREVQGQR